ATDSDGTATAVTFYVNGTSIGADNTAPFTVPWTPSSSGAFTLTAVATDNQGAATTSTAIHVTIDQPVVRRNVALASNGSFAIASSTLTPDYPPSGAINGDRKGLLWSHGGGWNDGTPNSLPDWIEVDFN